MLDVFVAAFAADHKAREHTARSHVLIKWLLSAASAAEACCLVLGVPEELLPLNLWSELPWITCVNTTCVKSYLTTFVFPEAGL